MIHSRSVSSLIDELCNHLTTYLSIVKKPPQIWQPVRLAMIIYIQGVAATLITGILQNHLAMMVSMYLLVLMFYCLERFFFNCGSEQKDHFISIRSNKNV